MSQFCKLAIEVKIDLQNGQGSDFAQGSVPILSPSDGQQIKVSKIMNANIHDYMSDYSSEKGEMRIVTQISYRKQKQNREIEAK